MSIDRIASEALSLSVRDRALLAASLWESTRDPFDETSIPDEEAITLAIDRDREVEAGEAKAISHEDMMRRLRK